MIGPKLQAFCDKHSIRTIEHNFKNYAIVSDLLKFTSYKDVRTFISKTEPENVISLQVKDNKTSSKKTLIEFLEGMDVISNIKTDIAKNLYLEFAGIGYEATHSSEPALMQESMGKVERVVFSEKMPVVVSKNLVDFVNQNSIQLIEPKLDGLFFEGTEKHYPLDELFRITIIKSIIPFYPLTTIRTLFSDIKRDSNFFSLYYRARMDILLLPEDRHPSEYEYFLRDELIRFELKSNFPSYYVTAKSYGDDSYDYPYVSEKERKSAYSRKLDERIVPKLLGIVFLNKDNVHTLFNDQSDPRLMEVHNYIQANLDKFDIQKPASQKVYTEEDDCLYFGDRGNTIFYLHKKIRVPMSRLCPELQARYAHQYPGLDIDVDEDDLPILQTIDWYMRLDKGRIVVYHKPYNRPEEEMKYFIFNRLISEHPEYKFVIYPIMAQTCMCKYMLTILRLHTATNKNGYEKSIPATIIKQRFEKYNAMSYQTICKLYQNALVVNGAQEILPQFTTTGLFTEVVPGNDWLTHEQMLRYRVPEQHNLLPNNDCNTEKIMTPLQTVDSANGTDDPPLVQLACDIDQTVYLTQPERLKLA